MTKVLIVNENHIQRTPDGKCWSNGIVDYSVFHRYLEVFDEVLVAVRITDVIERDEKFVHLCSGEGVIILPIPDFTGARAFFKNRHKVIEIIKSYCKMVDCAIIRTPSAISFQFLKYVDGKIPYALEVATDPWVWLAKGEQKFLLRPFIRYYWTYSLKKYCMKSNGVSYVTKEALQRSYPCRAIIKGETKDSFSTYYSTVSICGNIRFDAKEYVRKKPFKLIHIANAFTTYSKGHRECIDVVSRLIQDGLDVSIDFVGDGPLKSEFEEYASKKNIKDKVRFVGRLNSKEAVLKALRESDLFLFPTHSEGLPRVVIESLYVGTPCISTNVGGIPELLEPECITDVGDIERMYSILSDLINNPEKMIKLSKKGIDKASEYTEEILQLKRVEFCRKLKSLCTK